MSRIELCAHRQRSSVPFRSRVGLAPRVACGVGLVLAVTQTLVPAEASGPCVRIGSTCFPTVEAALDAAVDGDVVRVPPGRFPGDVTITRSITLVGAGAGKTVLVGGGPVVTVGDAEAHQAPTVTIEDLTLRGGRTRHDLFGHRFVAAGGGLEIPAVAGGAEPGATVKVLRSVITGNRAAPARQLEQRSGPDVPQCPDGPCPFAGAFGGGIDNHGVLTLIDTKVTRNTVAGSLTSDAMGGGVYNAGELTAIRSTISRNRAVASRAWGRFAEGGGIMTDEHTATGLTLRHSTVSSNRSTLRTSFPTVLDDGTPLGMITNGGGVNANADIPVTVVGSRINRNRSTFIGPNATDGPFSDAINVGLWVGVGPLTLRDSSISGNHLVVRASSADVIAGGVLEWDGVARVSGIKVNRNRIDVRASDGNASALGPVETLAISILGDDPGRATLRDSEIRGNRTTLTARHGNVQIIGGGLINDSNLRMARVRISNNRATARSRTALVQGGGIFNGPVFGVTAPPSALEVHGSRIVGNHLRGPRGATLRGGGVFNDADATATLRATRVARNQPDQCFGCGR